MRESSLPPETRFWQPASGSFQLESGLRLQAPRLAYRSWGRLDPDQANAVLVCHPLTGSADVDHWWPDLLGEGRLLDPLHQFVLCANVLGSCYGSTGPSSTDPLTGHRYGRSFPPITIRDMVRLEAEWIHSLGIRRLSLILGGSLGGMRALEWGALFPDRTTALVAIATTDRQPPWAIAFSEAQRLAIQADPDWLNGDYPPERPPRAGLRAARAMAMVSYRHWHEFTERFGRRTTSNGKFEVVRWLAYHGEQLAERFDAGSYVTLTHAMDTHDLGQGCLQPGSPLPATFPPTLVVGIRSDLLYPPDEQLRLAKRLPQSETAWLDSPRGHDAFLVDTADLTARIQNFMQARCKARQPQPPAPRHPLSITMDQTSCPEENS
jgi:homoserine O-acetyltransferase